MKTRVQIGLLALSLLPPLPSYALDFGSTTDLWDISQGTTITGNSPFDAAFGSPHPYDARDIFGGHFGDYLPESGDVVFNDNQAAGFVHYVQWKTFAPVTVGSFKLYAAADGDPSFQREIARFRLLAKSPNSATFDLTLFDVSPDRPYTYLDVSTYLLIQANISAITAQEFRAEFFDVGGTFFGGPRVIELDAFAPVPEPTVIALLVGGAFVMWRSRRSVR
ncbi:MAG TPA: PEP-CTERM sorting domain-containing protein [Verrucomicrobiae bacterium]|nr:PEP-CTERM sorting domain-containing protein [Verrucomicrobiae bacterium]